MKKILVIGAGLSGATIARQLAEGGCEVEIVDSRNHVAGNAFDEIHPEVDIRYHKYGPHLFHTNNMKVVEFLSRFTEWLPYEHRVKALTPDGDYVTFPPNRKVCERYTHDELINIFFAPYTKKMWGMDMSKMDPSVIARVPIKPDSDEDRYFSDKFQAVPKGGYTAMVENMLDHENITVYLESTVSPDFFNTNSAYDHVFNSAPIDAWFEFKHGTLPYRSIKFKHSVVNMPKALPATTVNFTHDGPPTRITEWKKLPGHEITRTFSTLLTSEEPCDYLDNSCERYYPVKDVDGKNRKIYEEYVKEVPVNMTFIGRCGQYVYIDMHQAVNQGLQISEKFLK